MRLVQRKYKKAFGVFVAGLAMILMSNLSSLAELKGNNYILPINYYDTIVIKDDNGEVLSGTWTSDNESVCTIDSNGAIQTFKAGASNITFTSSGGKTYTYTITVKQSKQYFENTKYIVGSNTEAYEEANETSELSSTVEDTQNEVDETEVDNNNDLESYGQSVFGSVEYVNSIEIEDDADMHIDAGLYIVRAIGNNPNCTVETEGSILGVKYNMDLADGSNSIIKVEDGDVIKLHNCELLDIYEPIDTTGSGNFIVGIHVPIGNYLVETDNAERGAVEIYSDYTKENPVYTEIVTQDSPVNITLAEGQLVSLINTKLT